MLGDEVFKQTLIELKRIRFTDSQVMRERENSPLVELMFNSD